MRRCLQLACLGAGRVSPNPLVGAVLVHDGRIIGEGWHQQYGQAHAEVHAIRDALRENAHLIKESALYVNLEPCSHTGKTPPCADLILQYGIPTVIIAQRDPNPLVAGRGIEKLRQHGVNVWEGVLEPEAKILNRAFNSHIVAGRPYIILKWAQSADGYLGRPDRQVWLSCASTRRLTHRWRSEVDAILVGTHTARIDNPALSNRYFTGKTPLRIVLDRTLALPEQLALFDGHHATIVATAQPGPYPARTDVHYLKIDFDQNLLPNLLDSLYHRWNIGILMVEGGAATLQSFIDQQLCDECRIIRTPVVLGGGIKAPLIYASPFEVFGSDADQIEVYHLPGNRLSP